MPPAQLAQVRGVLTDIDDTLTRDGAIEPAALAALHALHRAQVPVIAITGRPVGWSRPFAHDWPVAAIVAENGAVALRRQGDMVHVEYTQDASTRQANHLRLHSVAARVLREVPGATMAQDSAGRETDIAIDHSEFTQLPQWAIDHVVRVMRSEGMHATISSIHINGWFGDHNKLSGAQWMVQRLFGRPLQDEIDEWLFVGDSTNDQLMFGACALSVGVANVMNFAQQLTTWPHYITQGERGEGFAEVTRALLVAPARALSTPSLPRF
jgi:HAD superfamily hydrolase (TIGR01484 family)